MTKHAEVATFQRFDRKFLRDLGQAASLTESGRWLAQGRRNFACNRLDSSIY